MSTFLMMTCNTYCYSLTFLLYKIFFLVSYSRETIFAGVSDKSSSSSLLSEFITIIDLTVNCDPVVESEGSSSSILFNVSGGWTESSVSSFEPVVEVQANNRGPANSSKSSNGVSGVGGGEVARPDPAAHCWPFLLNRQHGSWQRM